MECRGFLDRWLAKVVSRLNALLSLGQGLRVPLTEEVLLITPVFLFGNREDVYARFLEIVVRIHALLQSLLWMAHLETRPDLLSDLVRILPERLHQPAQVVEAPLLSLKPFLSHRLLQLLVSLVIERRIALVSIYFRRYRQDTHVSLRNL